MKAVKYRKGVLKCIQPERVSTTHLTLAEADRTVGEDTSIVCLPLYQAPVGRHDHRTTALVVHHSGLELFVYCGGSWGRGVGS